MKHSNETELLHSIFAGALSCMGPLGRKLSGHFSSGDHVSVAACEQPATTDESFVNDYAAYNFLRKYDGLNTGIDPAAVAIAKWEETEVACQALNESWDADNPRVAALLFSAQRKISQILGSFDPDEFFDSIDHSGGASTQRGRRTSAVENKESDNHAVTLLAQPLLVAVQRHLGYYATPSLRNFSRFATVPKDATTDRPIIIENQGNMLLQKAIGKMIRRRLRRVGVDLDNQAINQSRAALADIATIDLSSASDLIWSRLVLLLLGPQWADIIFCTRCPYVEINGRIHELQKIGGMGNGFVFELESLIFYAVVSASIELRGDLGPDRPNHVTVYGDDIIVDAIHAETAIQALETFGFRINRNKSFYTGPFRESCGFHYHNGKLCTPIYIKQFDFQFGAWYHLYNSLRLLGDRISVDFGRQLRRIEHYLKAKGEFNLVPSSYGLRAGIHASFDEACPTAVRKPRNRKIPWVQGYKVRINRPGASPYYVCQLGAYLRCLRKMSQQPDFRWEAVGYSLGMEHRKSRIRSRVACYIPNSFTPKGGYNNDKGDRKFNLRTSDHGAPEVFVNDEISVW